MKLINPKIPVVVLVPVTFGRSQAKDTGKDMATHISITKSIMLPPPMTS